MDPNTTKALEEVAARAAADTVAKMAESIPYATAQEPFTGLMLFYLIALVVVLVVAFGLIGLAIARQVYQIAKAFTSQSDENNKQSDIRQKECHASQMTCLRMAVDANAVSAAAADRSARAAENCTQALDRVMEKLG